MESFKLDNIFSFPNIIVFIMGVYAILVWINQQIQKRLWRRDMIRVNLFFEKAIKDKRQDIWVREEGYTSGCLNWYSQYGFDKDFRSRTVKMSRQYKTGDYVEWSHILRSSYDHDLLVAYSVENEDTLLRVKLGSYGIPYFSDLSLLDSELKENLTSPSSPISTINLRIFKCQTNTSSKSIQQLKRQQRPFLM